MTDLELELLNRVVDAECEARRYGQLLQSANEAADNAFRKMGEMDRELQELRERPTERAVAAKLRDLIFEGIPDEKGKKGTRAYRDGWLGAATIADKYANGQREGG